MSGKDSLNELDRAIMALRKSTAGWPEFCRRLGEGELRALLPFHPELEEGAMMQLKNGMAFPFATLRDKKGDVVPIFSSGERMEEGLKNGKVRPKTYVGATMEAKLLLQ